MNFFASSLSSSNSILSSEATLEVRLYNENIVEITIIGDILPSSNDAFNIYPIDNTICGADSNIAS